MEIDMDYYQSMQPVNRRKICDTVDKALATLKMDLVQAIMDSIPDRK
jgi:hypothetical protein